MAEVHLYSIPGHSTEDTIEPIQTLLASWLLVQKDAIGRQSKLKICS